MRKITEYAMVMAGGLSLHEFSDRVNEKINEGFQPYGYPRIAGASSADADEHPQSDFVIMQAMVRYESDSGSSN